MAKRRKSSGTTIVRQVPVLQRSPAPIIRVQTSTPRAPKAKRRRSRGRGKGGSHGGLTFNHMAATAFGGFALGFINKTFPSLPTLPIIGRSGSIALGAWFLAKHMGGGGTSGLLRDVAMAGAAVAGFELGTTGKVSGDVDGDLAPQVSGIAAQV